jgi:hypothetical protein
MGRSKWSFSLKPDVACKLRQLTGIDVSTLSAKMIHKAVKTYLTLIQHQWGIQGVTLRQGFLTTFIHKSDLVQCESPSLLPTLNETTGWITEAWMFLLFE